VELPELGAQRKGRGQAKAFLLTRKTPHAKMWRKKKPLMGHGTRFVAAVHRGGHEKLSVRVPIVRGNKALERGYPRSTDRTFTKVQGKPDRAQKIDRLGGGRVMGKGKVGEERPLQQAHRWAQSGVKHQATGGNREN